MEPYSEEELIAFGEFIICELELYGEIDDILKSFYNKGIDTPWLQTYKEIVKRKRRDNKLSDLGI